VCVCAGVVPWRKLPTSLSLLCPERPVTTPESVLTCLGEYHLTESMYLLNTVKTSLKSCYCLDEVFWGGGARTINEEG
jgi:hypothetical protein